jgi:hypothetical protein
VSCSRFTTPLKTATAANWRLQAAIAFDSTVSAGRSGIPGLIGMGRNMAVRTLP